MIGKVTGSYGLDASGKSRAKKGYGAGSPSDGDSADFSSFAVELARVNAELKALPDVRQELVADLKEQVEAGEYYPPLEAVARHLYLAGILNLDE
ncbi:MAG: flagellar biosynthesis anti-sigma factor FlgM [Fretibacterium sp.]|nr:flagellar biosynthesis anti-sigma factor FlgM [Fretibacterium sp.]